MLVLVVAALDVDLHHLTCGGVAAVIEVYRAEENYSPLISSSSSRRKFATTAGERHGYCRFCT
ncbi:hypothetical protein GH141_03960 [bacterium]|nr:hypothetical protein [bacterium]